MAIFVISTKTDDDEKEVAAILLELPKLIEISKRKGRLLTINWGTRRARSLNQTHGRISQSSDAPLLLQIDAPAAEDSEHQNPTNKRKMDDELFQHHPTMVSQKKKVLAMCIIDQAIDDANKLYKVVEACRMDSEDKKVFMDSVMLFVEQLNFNKLRLQVQHDFDLNLLPSSK